MTHVDRKGEGVDGHFFIHTYVLNTAHAAQSQTSVNLVHVFEQLHYQFLLKCMVFSGSVKRPCGSTGGKGVSKMSKIPSTWFMDAPLQRINLHFKGDVPQMNLFFVRLHNICIYGAQFLLSG